MADLRGEERPVGGYGKIETSYYKAAQTLSGKTGDYWKRPTEMFARSFESYVFDRLGQQSDYLVHGVEGDRYTKEKGYKGNPYPVGVEREAINGAFNTLFDTMESKPTDQGTALFERRGPSDEGPTPAEIQDAITDGLPIGETEAKIIDSSNQYPEPMMADLARAPYVKRLSKEMASVVEELKQVLLPSDRAFATVTYSGLSPDDYYHGVNLRGQDTIILNPWTLLWSMQKAVEKGRFTQDELPEYTSAALLKTLVHELIHQQVITSHKDAHTEEFDRQLDQNYGIVGLPTLKRLQRRLMATLEGDAHVRSIDHLARDLQAQRPFWLGRDGLSHENFSRDAEPDTNFDRQNVAGEGTRGRTGPPANLRRGGRVPASTLDDRATVQRRGTSDLDPVSVATPSFARREAEDLSPSGIFASERGSIPVSPLQTPQYSQESKAYRQQRAAEDTGTIDTVIARGRLHAAITSARPYLLGALGLHQISSVYGKDHPEVAAYNKASQQMEADFTSMTRESDGTLKKWDKLKTTVSDRMARVMENARLANYDPDPEPTKTHHPTYPVSAKDVAVRQAFEQLPEEAQAVYREVRDFYSTMAEQRFEAIRGRIDRSGATPEFQSSPFPKEGRYS